MAFGMTKDRPGERAEQAVAIAGRGHDCVEGQHGTIYDANPIRVDGSEMLREHFEKRFPLLDSVLYGIEEDRVSRHDL